MPTLVPFLAPVGALAALALALVLAPAPAPFSTNELAEWAIAESRAGGDPTAVAAAYQEVLAREPGHVRANWGLAMAAYAAKDFKAADAYFQKALEKDPGNQELQLSRAAALQKQRRLPEAVALYEALLAKDPKNAKVLNNLAEAEIDRRDYKAARAYLKRYLDTIPPRSTARIKVMARLSKLDRAIGDAPAASPRPAASPARK